LAQAAATFHKLDQYFLSSGSPNEYHPSWVTSSLPTHTPKINHFTTMSALEPSQPFHTIKRELA
jgi:hypothetical protein